VATAIVPVGPALVYAARLSGSSGGSCGKYRNALSALYPQGSEEKRLIDAMLLAVPR
jgi:hypothetical protein